MQVKKILNDIFFYMWNALSMIDSTILKLIGVIQLHFVFAI